MKGKLYLIPTTLGDVVPEQVLPEPTIGVIHTLSHFIVEREKTARRFLKRTQTPVPMGELELFPLNKRTQKEEYSNYLQPAEKGKDIGLLSEAGMPAIADPGSEIVALAHQKDIQVIPLIGPSSILLALTASGFNGQQFVFHGYLPIKQPQRIKSLKNLEKKASQNGQTQIFMETPYRNIKLLEDLLKTGKPSTRLCIAADLTLPSELIQTQSLSQWKKQGLPDIHKRPAIFLIGK